MLQTIHQNPHLRYLIMFAKLLLWIIFHKATFVISRAFALLFSPSQGYSNFGRLKLLPLNCRRGQLSARERNCPWANQGEKIQAGFIRRGYNLFSRPRSPVLEEKNYLGRLQEPKCIGDGFGNGREKWPEKPIRPHPG